jgi:hypothetical protein
MVSFTHPRTHRSTSNLVLDPAAEPSHGRDGDEHVASSVTDHHGSSFSQSGSDSIPAAQTHKPRRGLSLWERIRSPDGEDKKSAVGILREITWRDLQDLARYFKRGVRRLIPKVS